jgi:hypothetical protein
LSIQPINQGIIKSLKRRDSWKFVRVLLEKTESGTGLIQSIKTINIKMVIYMIAQALD